MSRSRRLPALRHGRSATAGMPVSRHEAAALTTAGQDVNVGVMDSPSLHDVDTMPQELTTEPRSRDPGRVPGGHRLPVPPAGTAARRPDARLRGQHPPGLQRAAGVPRRRRPRPGHLRAALPPLPRLPGRRPDQDQVGRRQPPDLRRISKQLDLGDFLFLGKGMNVHDGAVPPSMLADVFESLVAAIYLDGGLEAAKTFILRAPRPGDRGGGRGAARRQLQVAAAAGGPARVRRHAAVHPARREGPGPQQVLQDRRRDRPAHATPAPGAATRRRPSRRPP